MTRCPDKRDWGQHKARAAFVTVLTEPKSQEVVERDGAMGSVSQVCTIFICVFISFLVLRRVCGP